MTTNDPFLRQLTTWLHEDAEHHVPDHLAEVLERSAATRQRAAWSSPGRWLPMDLSVRRSVFDRPNLLRPVALLVLIGLLLAAIVALVVGSSRPALEPFGLARNGVFVSSSDGDIQTIDPATSARSPLIGGGAFDFSPVFSRDGSHLLFLRSDGPPAEPAILSLMVARADGSDLHAVTPAMPALDWFDWSPDGGRIAFVSSQQLWVVNRDGTGLEQLAQAGPAHFPTWLPPDGDEIVFRRETMQPGIFSIRPDGTGVRQVSSRSPNNEFDYQAISAAPDGSEVSFTRWSAQGIPRVFALDPLTGTEQRFRTRPGYGQRGTIAYAPDGGLVAYARSGLDGATQIVIASRDGSGRERAIGPEVAARADGSLAELWWTFTPDGSALIARYGDDESATLQLLPLDGSPGSVLQSGSFDFVDVQRLPR
jgi:Tol biopolymer transport system component